MNATNDKMKALETALGQIERQFGKGAVMRLGDRPQPFHLPCPGVLPPRGLCEAITCPDLSWKTRILNFLRLTVLATRAAVSGPSLEIRFRWQ